jgi:medium-chain acyl-[acyl-carrier-protein] hydrolase
MTSAPKSWFAHNKPRSDAQLRLFCFPYAGGGASIFRTWSDDLPPQIEVYPIQPPGRENRLADPLFTELPALVEALAVALRPHLTMPFAFFGHSLGALVSFEVARELWNNEGLQPVQLFVSGCAGPCVAKREPPFIHTLPESDFVAELRRLNGTPETVLQHPELMQLMLPVLRADFGMRETYTYIAGELLASPILAFGGTRDRLISRADLEMWHHETKGMFTLRMIPGDHFFLHSARVTLLQMLSHELLRVLPSER